MAGEQMTGAGSRYCGEADGWTEAQAAQSFVRHELRTPLAVLQPVLDMLLSGSVGQLEPRQQEYAAMLERNVARLAGMITSLVDTGWLEVAFVPVAEQPVEVVPLLEELARLVPAQFEQPPRLEIAVRRGDRGAKPPVVHADPHRLRLAVRNLLVNACTFTPASGRVRIAVGVSGGSVTVQVTDSGIGIPADELPRVFDLGYQGSAARARSDRGLGMGLPVTRVLVEAAGGSVTLDSEAGRGTTAAVTLPAFTA
jgi:signal transduction histidine kinase